MTVLWWVVDAAALAVIIQCVRAGVMLATSRAAGRVSFGIVTLHWGARPDAEANP